MGKGQPFLQNSYSTDANESAFIPSDNEHEKDMPTHQHALHAQAPKSVKRRGFRTVAEQQETMRYNYILLVDPDLHLSSLERRQQYKR